MVLRFLLSIMAVVMAPSSAEATKPCPPPLCSSDKECKSLAKWVAEGTIHNIQHHKEGYPLHKDFAEFTFSVSKWINPPSPNLSIHSIRFKVGWCHNMQELPSITDGTFRFFGANTVLGNDPNQSPQYLYFKKVD